MIIKSGRIVSVSLAIIALMASTGHADCAACTKSYGVRIPLKSGAIEEGYLPWNNFYFEELISGYGLQQNAAARELIKDWYTLQDREAFARWIEVVNFVVRRNIPLRVQYQEHVFTLYRDLVQIKYPLKRYVAVEGNVIQIPISSIIELAASEKHQLNIDTTGISVLSQEDVSLLKEKKPRFWIEEEGSTGAAVWAVYGKNIHLPDVLEHLMNIPSSEHGRISVNGVLIKGEGDYVPVDSGRPMSDLGPLQKQCEEFLRKSASFERPQWKSMKTGKDGRIPGIVIFGYGWD